MRGEETPSARKVALTKFANYPFGAPGDTWRPYIGVGLNYTRFVDFQSRLAPDVQMSDSVGPAAKVGVTYALDRQWSVMASVSATKVKSDVVAAGSTVLTATIDLRPVIYSIGAAYRF